MCDKERKGVYVVALIIWRPVCQCCGASIGGKKSTADGNPPSVPPKMSGICPSNPLGKNHLPKWEKESEIRKNKKLRDT